MTKLFVFENAQGRLVSAAQPDTAPVASASLRNERLSKTLFGCYFDSQSSVPPEFSSGFENGLERWSSGADASDSSGSPKVGR
jgi:hypothetical protein